MPPTKVPASALASSSVPNPKFLWTLGLDMECATAEAGNRGEDIVCGLGSPERLGIGVAGVDVGGDGGFQCLGGAVSTALDLLFGEESE